MLPWGTCDFKVPTSNLFSFGGIVLKDKREVCLRTTHNAIIVLQVLMKSRALSAECLLGLQHSVLSALKCARFTVH